MKRCLCQEAWMNHIVQSARCKTGSLCHSRIAAGEALWAVLSGSEEKTLSSASITPTSAGIAAVSSSQTPSSRCRYLFKGLEHLSSLTEVLEDELQRARHQRGVILHDEMDQNPQECPAAFIIQLHCT